MAAPLTRLVSELHRLTLTDAPDAELLGRFVARRDEAAFQALVERHGPMVQRLCARILGDAHAAEDACQAAFLVLARKAGTLKQPASLAGWLYGVTQHIAWKSRARRLRRCLPALAEPRDPAPDPLSALTARELLHVLEEELARLPEAQRMAIVLCCLDGRSREEAAVRLGCTLGALRGHLARGRQRLHTRLVKRGVTLSAALAAAEVVHGSVTAMTFSGNAASGEALRLAAAALRGGTLLKLPMVLMVVLGGSALWLLAGGGPAADEQPTAPQLVAAGKSAPVDAQGDPLPPEAIGRIGSSRLRTGGSISGLSYAAGGNAIVSATVDGGAQFWDAATGKLQRSVPAMIDRATELRESADGKTIHLFSANTYRMLDAVTGVELRRVAVRLSKPGCRVRLAPDGSVVAIKVSDGPLRIFELTGGTENHSLPLDDVNIALAFTPDGKTLAAGGAGGVLRLFDVGTGRKRGEFKLPLQYIGRMEIAPDGNTLLAAGRFESLAIVWDLRSGRERCRIRHDSDRLDIRSVAFAPDSGSVAVGGSMGYCTVHDIASGKEVRRFPTGRFVECLTFSRDGRTPAPLARLSQRGRAGGVSGGPVSRR